MAQQLFTAIETQSQVRKAMKDWHEKFATDAENIDGLGGTVLWHSRLRMWGHFRSWKRDDGSDRYWNSVRVLDRTVKTEHGS